MEAPHNVEVTCRHDEENDFYFIMNHNDESREVRLPKAGTDILTDTAYEAGDSVLLDKKGVAVIRSLRD